MVINVEKAVDIGRLFISMSIFHIYINCEN